MKYTTLIVVIVIQSLAACSTSPSFGSSYCGGKIDSYKAANLKQRYRGADNGAQDTDRDGRIDFHESFSQWEFMQIDMVLQQGVEYKPYFWTNIDTCYSFRVVAGDFYEDKSKGVLYESACRKFTVEVEDADGNYLGSEKNHACRNFGTHRWEIY